MNNSLTLRDNKLKIKTALSKYSQNFNFQKHSPFIQKQTLPKPPQFFQEVQQIDTQTIFSSQQYFKDEQTKPSKLNTSRGKLSSVLNESTVMFKKKAPIQKNIVSKSLRLPTSFECQKQFLLRSKIQKNITIKSISLKTNVEQQKVKRFYKKTLKNKLFLLSLEQKIQNKTQTEQKFIIQDYLIKKLQKEILYQQTSNIIQSYQNKIVQYLQSKLLKIRKERSLRGEK